MIPTGVYILFTLPRCCDMDHDMRETAGHRYLRRWFADQPWLVQSHEAEAMAMSKQQLSHILKGRRSPTLRQALAIAAHTGCDIDLWVKG